MKQRIIIDVTFGGVCLVILDWKVSRRRHFRPYHDKGSRRGRLCGEKIRVSRPCCSRCGTIFSTTNGKREKSVSFAASAGLSFPGIYVPRTMTSEGAKKKRPAPTATAEGTCPFVVNIGNAPTPKFHGICI